MTALADPESTIAGAVIGMLSDYVFDAASSAFDWRFSTDMIAMIPLPP